MNKALLLNLIICFTLTACGEDSASPSNNSDGTSDISNTTPESFGFIAYLSQELPAEVTSNEVTLTEIDDAQDSIHSAEHLILMRKWLSL